MYICIIYIYRHIHIYFSYTYTHTDMIVLFAETSLERRLRDMETNHFLGLFSGVCSNDIRGQKSRLKLPKGVIHDSLYFNLFDWFSLRQH